MFCPCYDLDLTWITAHPLATRVIPPYYTAAPGFPQQWFVVKKEVFVKPEPPWWDGCLRILFSLLFIFSCLFEQIVCCCFFYIQFCDVMKLILIKHCSAVSFTFCYWEILSENCKNLGNMFTAVAFFRTQCINFSVTWFKKVPISLIWK